MATLTAQAGWIPAGHGRVVGRQDSPEGEAGRLISRAGGHSAIEDLGELRPAARSALALALSSWTTAEVER